jgi:hypothetical protein
MLLGLRLALCQIRFSCPIAPPFQSGIQQAQVASGMCFFHTHSTLAEKSLGYRVSSAEFRKLPSSISMGKSNE